MDEFFSTHALHRRGDAALSGEQMGAPDALQDLLSRVSGNSYADGFFRFVSPSQLRGHLAHWGFAPEECVPFLKCAFGHLVFYHRREYKVLNPLFNDVDVLGHNLDFVMEIILCDRPGLESSFCIDVFERAYPKLGAPELGELYAFSPPLGLGGPRDAAYVGKSTLAVELPILSQI